MLDPRDPLSIKTLSSTTAAANAEAITASYVCVVNGAIAAKLKSVGDKQTPAMNN